VPIYEYLNVVLIVVAVSAWGYAWWIHRTRSGRIRALEQEVVILRAKLHTLEAQFANLMEVNQRMVIRERDLLRAIDRLERDLARARQRIMELEQASGISRLSILAVWPRAGGEVTSPADALYNTSPNVDYILIPPPVTRERVLRYLDMGRYNVVEVDAHGTDSGILLDTEEGGQDITRPGWWARVLRDRGIELAVLMACRTAEIGDSLSRAGIPYVVATIGDITERAASMFVRSFYRYLADGMSIPDAFDRARGALPQEDYQRVRLWRNPATVTEVM